MYHILGVQVPAPGQFEKRRVTQVAIGKKPLRIPVQFREEADIRESMRAQLENERRFLDDMLERTFRDALRELPLGSSEVGRSPQYWERLVDACTTIGSRALDVIEKRLVLIGHSMHWDSNLDYRTLAHQLYMATEQARKMKNVYMQRRKCVQAVLKATTQVLDSDKSIRLPVPLQDIYGLDPMSFGHLIERYFEFFKSTTGVNRRFFDMYKFEWKDFCQDFLEVSRKDSQGETILRSHYEKYALELEKQLTRSDFSFQTQKFSAKRNDIDLSDELALNLKLNSGELIMMYEFQKPTSVNIMDLSQEIFLALMDKFHIEFLGVVPINTGNKGIRVELPKPDKPELLKDIQSTVLEIFKNYQK